MSIGPSPTVLNADIDEGRRHAYRRPLSEAGYSVRDAPCGADDLRMASERPDVILLDLHLPDVSGFEVGCRLESRAATADSRVLPDGEAERLASDVLEEGRAGR